MSLISKYQLLYNATHTDTDTDTHKTHTRTHAHTHNLFFLDILRLHLKKLNSLLQTFFHLADIFISEQGCMLDFHFQFLKFQYEFSL